MFIKALIVSLVLGMGLTSRAEAPKREVEMAGQQVPVYLDSKVTWEQCGDWNGSYEYASHDITLCDENLDLGLGPARFIYLHELGHAYTFSRHMTYERWAGNYEAAADEWAAVMLIVAGRAEDVRVMADVWERWGLSHPHRDGDPHPPAELRAAKLRALYWGYKIPVGSIGADWNEAREFWYRQLLTEHQDD